MLKFFFSFIFLLSFVSSHANNNDLINQNSNYISQNIYSNIHFTKQELDFIRNNKVVVSTELANEPFNFKLGENSVGYTIDILNLISKKTGLIFEFYDSKNEKETNELFQENKIQVLTNKIDLDLDDELSSSKIYINLDYYFFSKNNFTKFVSLDELSNVNIALKENSFWSKIIKDRYPNINIIYTKSMDESIQKVLVNEADLTIINNISYNFYKQKYKIKNIEVKNIDSSIRDLISKGYHFTVKKENKIITDIINKAIKSITLDELKNIDKKWLATTKSLSNSSYKINLNSLEDDYLNKKNRTLNFCLEPNFINLLNSDTRLYKSFIKKIEKDLDVKLNYIKSENKKNSLELIKNKKCDLLPIAIKSYDKKQYLDFTDSYIKSPYVLATREKNLYLGDLQDVIEEEIAIVQGQEINEYLKKRYPDKNFIEVQNVEEGLKLLDNGYIFGFLDSLMTTAYAITKNNYFDTNISSTFDYNLEISIATRNDEPLLNSIMNQFISSISEEYKKEIFNTWFNIDMIERIDYNLFFKVVFVLVALLLIGFLWSLSIHREKVQTKKSLIEVEKLRNELVEINDDLIAQTMTDELTQLYNRRKIVETINYELKKFNRMKNNFSIILIDIDFFKKINDNYGHIVGDNVLKEFANILKTNVRDYDIVGRWGGEEFIIIAPDTSIQNAEKLANKLRKTIESSDFKNINKITASFGVSHSKEGDDKVSLLDRADRALYTSKNSGRNKVVAFN